jgi:PASTA domain
MLRRKATPAGADLVVLPLDDDETADLRAPVQRPSLNWYRIGAAALAVVAVGALVTIAWAQREQANVARHQECIADAQSVYGNGPFQGPVERAIAACFGHPAALLHADQPINVPGMITLTLSEVTRTLPLVGLQVGAVHGPTTDDSIVTSQKPTAGTPVPPGTSVDVWTIVPQARGPLPEN